MSKLNMICVKWLFGNETGFYQIFNQIKRNTTLDNVITVIVKKLEFYLNLHNFG